MNDYLDPGRRSALIEDRRRVVALTQGVYFAATGIWPLLDMRSFEKVTGPKADKWLGRTVGALVAVIGGALVSAAVRRSVTNEIAGLAVGSAAGLAAIDVVYATSGRISKIYLCDAAAEAILIGAWGSGSRRRFRAS